MRTTLTLDEDVADRTKTLADKLGKPFKNIVNQALRVGLQQIEAPTKQRRYRTKPHAMGLRKGFSLDNVQELLSQLEGDEAR